MRCLRVNVEKAGKWRKGRNVLEVGEKKEDIRRTEHMFFDSSSLVDDISATIMIQNKVPHKLYWKLHRTSPH